MITRRQRRKSARRKSFIIGAAVAAVIMFSLGGYNYFTDSIPVTTVDHSKIGFFEHLAPRGIDVISLGLPGMADKKRQQAPVKVRQEMSVQSAVHGMVAFFTGIDLKDIRSLLRVEIPFLCMYTTNAPTVSAMSLPNFPKFDFHKSVPAGKPLVAVYHTHTAESFIPSSGVSHRPGGQRGDIVDVGEALVKRLAENGVPAVQSKAIHDYPSFMKAYGPSEATARAMLAENPSIQMIFDIHRDAEKKENTTAIIDGVSTAKITIIVARGQQDLVQPHWEQNHAFAKLIDAKLNQHYPGLCRGIQLVEWRYNQHLHPRALLLEVGCQENTKEEAMHAMELLGDVLSEILAESQ